jgi:SNF2 family DNA or RNA helicase
MVTAEKVEVNNKLWIKASIPKAKELVDSMNKVKGAIFNPKTNLWAIPYEYLDSFEKVMSPHLILWKDGRTGPGGIEERTISPYINHEGYSVTYDSEGRVIESEGFKTPPIGEYQVRGVNAISNRNFLILADDCGLGKSWMAINAIKLKQLRGEVKRGLIICKATLVYNWRDEIAMHSDLGSVVVTGTWKQRNSIYTSAITTPDWTFLILGYEMYREDFQVINHLQNEVGLDFMIIDEGQKIKNPMSKIGEVIHYVPMQYKYILTATPLPNTPLEVFNYLKLGGLMCKNWWQFRNHHAIFGGYNNKEIVGYKNILEIRETLQKVMLRRLKEDKLKELPPVMLSKRYIPMYPGQAKLYDAIRKEILADLAETRLTSIPHTLAKVLRLQQITDCPALLDSKEPSSKLDTLDELLDDLIVEGNNKVIVFSKFKTLIDILSERLDKFNPAIIHGDIGASGKTLAQAERKVKKEGGNVDDLMVSDRQKQVYKFQKDETCKICLCSTSACREGLTLTAASHVIFLDLEYSWDYIVQAYSRAHRHGQLNCVNVYFLLCKDTVDERVMGIVEKKEMLGQAMLDADCNLSESRGREFIRRVI